MGILYFCCGVMIGIFFWKKNDKRKYNKWKAKIQKEDIMFRLVESSKDIVYRYEVKPQMRHSYISPSADAVLGDGMVKEFYRNPYAPLDIIYPEDYDIMYKKLHGAIDYSQPLVQRMRCSDGSYKWFEEYATPIYEHGELVAIHGIIRNIDEKVRLRENLEHQLIHDALTEVYNRFYFEQKMEEFDTKIDEVIAIIICDLDELKQVNDKYGHKQGDDLIKAAGKLLNTFSSPYITVSRIGGDEFVLLIQGMKQEEIEELYKRMTMGLSDKGKCVEENMVRMSIGYAFGQSSLGKMTALFTEADNHMYQNKVQKKKENKHKVLAE
ncbi:sensor domain-containing diguanylate cyclase [Niallia circulans]|uniref:sensor domain-containing diguanylate cyclase n=1 Tax=Niallia circulans TaxID=1397 RepID=UPI00156111AA|nr:sensor domain-containing diguanylate cyclase [Niallia circulans]NRG33136.1 sensor domain-containing diguanylate cyclase [Niallia circulans]